MNEPAEITALPSARPLVLVVEDEPGVRSMLGAALRAGGFDVEFAENGRVALDALRTGLAAQVILTDVRMPEMDGITFVRSLRADDALHAIPVVAMSAYNDTLQEREIIEAGADAFLPKPFTIADATAALLRVL